VARPGGILRALPKGRQPRLTEHLPGRLPRRRFTDTGPLLRLERPDLKLGKAQRYGHPSGRPIFSSSIGPAEMRALAISYLDFGQQGLAPKVGGAPACCCLRLPACRGSGSPWRCSSWMRGCGACESRTRRWRCPGLSAL
jgi:hypothetical protein